MESTRNNKYNDFELDELKQFYLDTIEMRGFSESTYNSVRNLMHRITNFEMTILNGKNIKDFNYEEIVMFLKYLGSSSAFSLQSQFQTLRDFCTFGQKEGHIPQTAPYLSIFKNTNLDKFVDQDKKNNRYMSKSEVLKAVDTLYNPIDKALVLAIFEGIKGNKNYELSNLKIDDVKDGKVEVITEYGEVIEKKISPILQRLLNDTINSDVYYSSNGNGSDDSNMGNYRAVDKIIESEYVFRPTEHYLITPPVLDMIDKGLYNGKNLSEATISSKVSRCLKKYCGLDYVSPLTLYHSGLLWRFLEECMVGEEKPSKQEFISFTSKEGISQVNSYKLYKLLDILLPKFVEERCIMK